METKNDFIKKVCPHCGVSYTAHSAVSRKDCKTLICPDCGTREALESVGVEKPQQDEILETIHRSYGFG